MPSRYRFPRLLPWSNVTVSGLSESSGGDRPSESMSLSYSKIAISYTQYDGAAGRPAPTASAGTWRRTGAVRPRPRVERRLAQVADETGRGSRPPAGVGPCGVCRRPGPDAAVYTLGDAGGRLDIVAESGRGARPASLIQPVPIDLGKK